MEEGKSRFSAPVLLLVEFSLALLLAVYLLYKYGNFRKHNPFVTGCTLLVWFLSFVIIFLLPVDVSSAFYRLCLDADKAIYPTEAPVVYENLTRNLSTYSCHGYVCTSSRPEELEAILKVSPAACSECFQPYTFICPLPLKILWYIIYWLYFILTWIVIPLGQSYVLASYFSVWKKMLRALIENALFYVTFLVIFIILFIYLVIVRKIIAFTSIPSLLATASNTWGLLILTVLLGYGLVEVPRSLWNTTRRRYTMNHCYFKAAKLYTDLAEADDNLKEVTERVEQVAQSLHYNDPLRKYVDVIIGKFPSDQQKKFSRGYDDYEDYRGSTTQDPLSKSGLEGLLKKTMKAVRVFNSTKIQWMALTDQTLDLEDVQTNSTSHLRRFQSSIRLSGDKWYHVAMDTIEWYWKLWIRQWVYRVGAIMLGILSILIVWCEVTFWAQFGDVRLSIFAELVYVLHNYGNYIAVELFSICIVAYLSVCAYFTVFRIRIFNLYHLAPHHSTDEYSLLFSAMLLSRLALPICLNYLYVIQVVDIDEHNNLTDTPQTAFAEATGNTNLIPWLTSYFYIYYPILIILVCLATIFSLGTRLVSILGYQKFIGEDDFSADYIDEGKTLMKRERRIRERNLKELGKKRNRDQVPFELLRESAAAGGGGSQRGIDQFASRRSERGISSSRDQTPLSDGDSSLQKLLGRVKGYASKGKGAVASKYHASKVAFSRRNKDKDDVVELLPPGVTSPPRGGASNFDISSRSNGNSSDSGYGRTRKVPSEPPKSLFDDI